MLITFIVMTVLSGTERSLKTTTSYHLIGVVCHIGTRYNNGHYHCYIPEVVNGKKYYHLLNDKEHTLISKEEFEYRTSANGYIFLYSTNPVGTFNMDPYSGHTTIFNSLRKKFHHNFRQTTKRRAVKPVRTSEIGIKKFLNKTPLPSLSQLISGKENMQLPVQKKRPCDEQKEYPKKRKLIIDSTVVIDNTESISSGDSPSSLPIELKSRGTTFDEAIDLEDDFDEHIDYKETDEKSHFVACFKKQYLDRTIESLSDQTWVNDQVINFMFQSLPLSSPNEHILVLDSLLFKLLSELNDPSDLVEKVLTAKLKRKDISNISSLDILIPINKDGHHWSVIYINTFQMHISYYDSIRGLCLDDEEQEQVRVILRVLHKKFQESKNKNWKNDNEKKCVFETKTNIPEQKNGYDCGLYACMFGKCLYFEEEMNFGSKFIKMLRSFFRSLFLDAENLNLISFNEDIWMHQNDPADDPEIARYQPILKH